MGLLRVLFLITLTGEIQIHSFSLRAGGSIRTGARLLNQVHNGEMSQRLLLRPILSSIAVFRYQIDETNFLASMIGVCSLGVKMQALERQRNCPILVGCAPILEAPC
jgi:ABC-type uncharacterized transport system permease subunit